MTLTINGIRRYIWTMIDTIKLKFHNRITSKVKNLIQSAIHRLIHFKKANFVQHENVKGSIGTGHAQVNTKIEQLRSDTESIQRLKSVAMFTSLSMPNILTTSNDAFNLNQARLIATSLFLYKVANTYLGICKKVNMQDLVRLNVLCILTDVNDKNQIHNIYYRVSYLILCNSL